MSAATARGTAKRAPKRETPEASVAGVRITSPDRVMFATPAVTKLELAKFYERIADHVLPELVDRPLSLVRCPDGAKKACFYQKHPSAGMIDAIRTLTLREASGSEGVYVYIEDVAGLIGLVQVNALEIHPWGAKVRDYERPDRIVMDLDPAPGLPLARVVTAAREIRERLRALKLDSFVRTSGGKGLHVVVPLVPRANWNAVKDFAQALARALERDAPDRYLSVATKSRREGLIFVDYLRNARGQTSVASYTLRAREGAPVATPLAWEELGRLRAPNQFRIDNLERRLARLRADPWERIRAVRQVLPRNAKL